MKYIITVHEIFPPTEKGETVGSQEVFKLGVDAYDPAALVQALTQPRRGRPAKTAKK